MTTPAIDGTTRLFAIIGDPVAAVRSPQYFNALFAERGINAAMFALQVSAGDLAVAWAGIHRMRNIAGVVFTMPHKVAACAVVDDIEPTGRLVGSINAARREGDGRWLGDMFDGHGCVAALLGRGHAVEGGKVFLLGVGGAGAAIAAALAQAGVGELVVQDLDVAKRDALVSRLARAYPGVTVRAGQLGAMTFDVAINATPLGMQPGDPLPFDPAELPRSTLIVDVITKPEMSPLLERAQASGHAVQTGRHMHEAQAMGIARFFGLV